MNGQSGRVYAPGGPPSVSPPLAARWEHSLSTPQCWRQVATLHDGTGGAAVMLGTPPLPAREPAAVHSATPAAESRSGDVKGRLAQYPCAGGGRFWQA